MIRVSIVMPTYNRADLITSSIQSVISQTYALWELIVVDDGSSDHTPSVVARFAKQWPERIRYFTKTNGGCASARNLGIRTARGEYLCFLDSDDFLLPDKLGLQVECLDRNAESGFVYSDALEFFAPSNQIYLSRVANHDQRGEFRVEHFISNHARAGAILYRKSAVEKVGGFREDFRYNEDSHFLQEIAMNEKGVYCAYPGYLVRNHVGSKSRHIGKVVEHEILSLDTILRQYPDFRRSHATLAGLRRSELLTKLCVAHAVSGELRGAIAVFAQMGLRSFAVGVARLLTRRLRKICYRIRDRNTVARYLSVALDTIGK